MRVQNLLVAAKFLLVIGFVLVGLWFGRHAWPEWRPALASEGFPWRAFLSHQAWIAFAFTGWNAAVYVAGDFKEPRRDVPWSVIAGAGLVALLYLLVNLVFVVNLTPAQSQAVVHYETTRITLGHLVMGEIAGPRGGDLMSLCAAAALVASIGAMTLIGSRVYVVMAGDGQVPAGPAGKASPSRHVALYAQGGAAILFLYTQQLREMVDAASSVLLCFSIATVLTLFRLPRTGPSPSVTARLCALFFAAGSGAIVVQQLTGSASALRAVTTLVGLGALSWAVVERRGRTDTVMAVSQPDPP
jgi:APA family basic amino acid/polyamine antiporter